MPVTLPLIGKELCLWCAEAVHVCPIHRNASVFWNDVSVKKYSDDSDGFRIVDEKDLINVERSVHYSENGDFIFPSNGSSLPISTVFHFQKVSEIPAPYDLSDTLGGPKKEKKPKKDVFKKPKLPKEPKANEKQKKSAYTKIHKNAIKSIAVEYKKGKKCDQSQKLFLCDICEFSFTLRHNLQAHLVQFHGKIENVSDEKISLLKESFPRKTTSEDIEEVLRNVNVPSSLIL